MHLSIGLESKVGKGIGAITIRALILIAFVVVAVAIIVAELLLDRVYISLA